MNFWGLVLPIVFCFVTSLLNIAYLFLNSLIKPGSKPPTTPVKLKKVSTFQEFESNTSDAWDLGDDDDELLAIAAENLNTEVVMETAHKVIQNHSKLQEQHKFQEEHLQEEKQEEFAQLTSVACGDNRLVKSVSEGHTSSSLGMLKSEKGVGS